MLKTERVTTAPYLGQVRAGVHGDGGECEHSGDAQGDAVRGGLPVQPEPHPGQHHDQRAGQVHLDTGTFNVTPGHFDIDVQCWSPE